LDHFMFYFITEITDELDTTNEMLHIKLNIYIVYK